MSAHVASLKLIVWLAAGSIVASAAATEDSAREPQSCHLRELELCAVGATSMFQNPNGLPVSDAELSRQCELFAESTDCLQRYGRKCLTDGQFGLAGLLFGVDQLAELKHQFCHPDERPNRVESGNSSEPRTRLPTTFEATESPGQLNLTLRQAYRKHVACYREFQRKYQTSCVSDLQVGFEFIHKLNRTQIGPTGCCNINRFQECVFGNIERDCGQPAVELLAKLLQIVTGNIINFTCRNFDPFGDLCLSLLPKIGTKPKHGSSTSALSRMIASFAAGPRFSLANSI